MKLGHQQFTVQTLLALEVLLFDYSLYQLLTG